MCFSHSNYSGIIVCRMNFGKNDLICINIFKNLITIFILNFPFSDKCVEIKFNHFLRKMMGKFNYISFDGAAQVDL